MIAPRFAQIAPRFASAVPRFASAALLFAVIAPVTAQAAPPDADRPAGAAAFVATSAENGTPSDLEAVLDLRETGPDAGVPRCLGDASFARTAWAWIAAADRPRRIAVEATAQSGSTAIPDLALFPQEPVTRATADVREPAACDGRESLAGSAAAVGAPAAGVGRLGDAPRTAASQLDVGRGDGSSAVTAVLRAGRPALVQVGWRDGDDTSAAVVVTLAARALEKRSAPPGDDPADAPLIALGAAAAGTGATPLGAAATGAGATPLGAAAAGEMPPSLTTAVALGGATLGLGDPAQPACPAPATVWRRVALPGAGVYAISASAAARTLTAFADPLGGDSALACADLADAPELKLTPRVAAAGPLWIRVGADQLDGDPYAQLHVSGPYADERAAAAAPVPGDGDGDGAGRGAGGSGGANAALACVRARAPRLTIAAASLRALRSGRGRTLSGTLRQPCDRSRPRATRVTVALGRREGGKSARCRWLAVGARTGARTRLASCARPVLAAPARGLARWRRTLPRRLAPGRHLLVVRAEARASRGRRTRIVATVRKTLTVTRTTPTKRATRR